MSHVELDDLRARVRADRRTVSAPLLAFGLLTVGQPVATAIAALAAGSAAKHTVALAYWPLGTAAALLALWWFARRLTVHTGLGPGDRPIRTVATGYLVALPVMVVLLVPLLFVGVFAPLLWAAAMLLVIGLWQRSSTLRSVATGLAAFGVLAAVAVIGTRAGWLQLALTGTAGAALVALSVVLDRRRAGSTP